jgi:hypothetical protein
MDALLRRALEEELSEEDLTKLSNMAHENNKLSHVINTLVLAVAEKNNFARYNLIRAQGLRSVTTHNINTKKLHIASHKRSVAIARIYGKPKRSSRKVLFITQHAIERYIERFRPKWDFMRAEKHMFFLSKSATPSSNKHVFNGCEQWISPIEQGVFFIVKRRPGTIPVCLTVLGPDERPEEVLSECNI